MSVAAMTWVFHQDIRPSHVKFVLLALADHVGQDGRDNVVWPSIAAISQKTSQDRKTVIAALDTLEAMRLLEDTGQRTGGTGQVKVYRIVGLPSSERHYTYRLTHKETGEFYLGVRSCNGDPATDDYFGSGKWPGQVGRDLLRKEILMQHPSRTEAEAHELQLIRQHLDDPKCKNVRRNGTVPLTELLRKSPADGQKESRGRIETVPPAGHGIGNESVMNRSDSAPEEDPVFSHELQAAAASTVSAEQIYEAYPLKVGRAAAIAKIRIALKKKPAAFLLERTQLFAAAVAKWNEVDREYVPHARTWFNQGRYDDDPRTWERKATRKFQGKTGGTFEPSQYDESPFGEQRRDTA